MRTEEKVVLAYLHPGHVDGAFMESVLDLLVFDMSLHRRIVHGGGRLAVTAGTNVAGPRNELVRKFLDYGQAEWLWMVDSDMTFRPDTLERLLDQADPDKAPIVGGLCFGFDEHGDIQPTLFGLVGDEAEKAQFLRYHEWKPDCMWQVAATGGACLLIHKTALERMRDFTHPITGQRGFNEAYPWFQETAHGGRPVGEDITFCLRAAQAGIPVYVNTSVHLGHIKSRELNMDAYFIERGLLSPAKPGRSE